MYSSYGAAKIGSLFGQIRVNTLLLVGLLDRDIDAVHWLDFGERERAKERMQRRCMLLGLSGKIYAVVISTDVAGFDVVVERSGEHPVWADSFS